MTNVAIAERFFEDETQTNLERFISSFDPDAEVDFSELDRPYGHVYKGPKQLETLFREMTGPWGDIRFETTNAVGHGEDVVLDVERTARSLESGFGVSSTLTARLTLRGDKISYFKLFQRRADALQSAGLPE